LIITTKFGGRGEGCAVTTEPTEEEMGDFKASINPSCRNKERSEHIGGYSNAQPRCSIIGKTCRGGGADEDVGGGRRG